MTDSSPDTQAAEIAKLIQRLFFHRHHGRIPFPESLTKLKKHLDETYLVNTTTIDAELFQSIGLIFSASQEPLTMGELSRSLDVPLSKATRIVNWLVKHHYAKRLSDPNDRRIVRVSLTAEGQEMYRTINLFITQKVERLVSMFTPQERQSLFHLLHKLLVTIESQGQDSIF